ncbi:hypothetical protein CI105_05525 [Candidatus Izimaplasma bacterium ZiA1]|uniref:hypothetical protein n=1 Tax=Candidatus Izimoplasma sp. ZiA1 TaxID=2024899 RepID=UPI000BAA40CA|nr:hypothetical protein CI105_05525 [Candidatus Izimaplasma bacterium ZiA1]
MSKYNKESINGYSYFTFDNIYKFKSLIFKNQDEVVYASIDNINFEVIRNINGFYQTFKVFGDNDIIDFIIDKSFSIETDHESTKGFIKNSGWTGADGVYSFELGTNVYWYFSDTFIGEVDKTTRKRVPGFKMINNSVGKSSLNNIFDIEFKYNQDNNVPSSIFVPNDGSYLWLQDGVIDNSKFYITALNVKDPVVKDEWFRVVGAKLIELPIINNVPDYNNYTIMDKSLLFEHGSLTYTFGASILNNKEIDGYIYVFGYDSNISRNMICFRTKDIANQLSYEYLLEDGYSKTINKNFKTLAKNIACEFRVIYDDDIYKIAYTFGSLSSDIVYGETLNIEDGFLNTELIYRCNEHLENKTTITYNAKLHKFSNTSDLYLTYNVNTLDNDEHINANIYYPRVLKLKKG